MRPMLMFLALCFWIGLCVGASCETMVASYYGAESGTRTASGARFHPHGLTAAHRTLPFGTVLRVCLDRCVVVRVTDRGPWVYKRGRYTRDLDISHGAARAIGMEGRGVARVEVERL